MSLHLDNMAIFVAIADYGGFTAAARALRLPKSTVSRRLSEYEQVLGITLFNRSTRSLSLTEAGSDFYSNAKVVVDAALDVGRSMYDRTAEPSGIVRLTATASTGHYLLAPALSSFLDRYPEVKVEMRLSDKRENIIEEGLDLAIRLGHLEDSELVARHLTVVNVLVVASPDLVAQSGRPNHPSDLADLECLVVDQSLSSWHFDNGIQVPVKWRVAPGSMLLAREMALQGQGYAQLPDFVVAQDLLAGRLQKVLSDYPSASVDASIVAPRQRYRSLAVRKFMDHLVGWYQRDRTRSGYP